MAPSKERRQRSILVYGYSTRGAMNKETKSTQQKAQPDYNRIARELLPCKRVAIVGNQGAGKTTLGRLLGDILQLEYVLLIKRPGQQQAIRERMARKERWVIDGDFGVLDLSDRIIYLEYPVTLCLWRAVKRAYGHIRLWSFTSPRVLLQIPPKLVQFFRDLGIIYKTSHDSYPGADSPGWMPDERTVTFTSPRQVKALLKALHSLKDL
jgi:energy-coupling factor transporter ATP-binding protein EcfA2